ncbi:MAG: Asp23/Gls24 family envelope stress response protein [Bacillota bacterium]
MGKEINTEFGKIAITDEVIATIAGVAATECYGIVGMSARRLKDGIAELLGRENLSKGVDVIVDQESVVVNLNVVIGYGTRISEVARNVREKVKYILESTTGLSVTQVNITVQGVNSAGAK